MAERLNRRPAKRHGPLIWGSAYILLGLRYSPDLAAQLFRGVVSMKESSTYQAILEEGRSEGAVAEAKKLLRTFGEDKLGAPDARTAAAIERIDDLGRLEGLCERLGAVKSW